MQDQARALGDPTRYGIFRYIADANRPVDVAEVTAWLGFNHNAIRQHLAKLVASDLVIEAKALRNGPGRPRLVYSIHPAADSRWLAGGPYERLAIMLTEIIRSGDTALEVGRRVGRRRRLVHSVVTDPVGVLATQMAAHGFEPLVSTSKGETRIVLRNCPFAAAAMADPDTVCNLHLGIALGLAETLGTITIDELRPTDPRRANCVLTCHTSVPV